MLTKDSEDSAEIEDGPQSAKNQKKINNGAGTSEPLPYPVQVCESHRGWCSFSSVSSKTINVEEYKIA